MELPEASLSPTVAAHELQQAFLDSELHRALALEGSALGTYEFFPGAGRMNWSNRTRELFGLGPDDPINMELFRSFVHPDDLPSAMANIEAAQQDGSNGVLEQEYRVLAADGSVARWVRSRGKYFPAHGDQPARFAGVVQDISAWKESEYWLSEGKQRLQAALTASGTGTFRWNIQTNALSWDENLDRLFGLLPGQTVRSLDSFIDRVHPDDRASVIEACRRCADEAADFDLPFRVVWPDGSIHWLDDKGKTYTDAEGRPAYMTGACVDITAKRQAEEALEDLVRERTRQLQQSNDDLQQFAHVASHDLKEPLRKARLFLSRFMEEETAIGPTGAEYLDKVQSALVRMTAMVEGVLSYSLLHGQEFLPEPVALDALLREIQVDLEVPIQETAAELRYGVLPVLEGSRVLLYQLFYNLLKNALKFTRAGVRPVITIEATGPDTDSGDLEIEVRDNGIGFPPEQAERIFEPFRRLHSKDHFEGTGLGLALCQKIMLRHCGSIRAEGRVGEGAAFFLHFPAAKKA